MPDFDFSVCPLRESQPNSEVEVFIAAALGAFLSVCGV
jgi:hypothetical protein